MRKMIGTAIGAAALLALATVQSLAHDAGPPSHGGRKVDAGNFHAELVADGSTTVVVYLSDEADKPIAATGFKASAIFVVGKQPVRFALAPADKTKLVGTAPVAVPAGVKGALQITAPDGSTAQAKY